jgi:uncharacterized protein YkvS
MNLGRNHRYFRRFTDAISEIGGVINSRIGLPTDLNSKVNENFIIIKVQSRTGFDGMSEDPLGR